MVRLLLNRNGRGSFLCREEANGEDRGRDVEPGFHGRSLSWSLATGQFYRWMIIGPNDLSGVPRVPSVKIKNKTRAAAKANAIHQEEEGQARGKMEYRMAM